MTELCLAEYPDKESPIAFQLVAMRGETAPLIKPLHAAFLGNMLRRAGVVDMQATILADLFRTGHVFKENVPYLPETLASFEPANILATAIYRAQKEDRVPKRVADIMRRLQEQTQLHHMMLLNKEGLVAETVTPSGAMVLYLEDNFMDAFGEDSLAKDLAMKLDLDAFAIEKELVWHPGEDGNLAATLSSDWDHSALGTLDDAGDFHHILTVLSPDHPLRRESDGLGY